MAKQEFKVGQFAKIKNDSLIEYGLKKGDHVYLGGSGFVRTSENDPYKYRLIFVACTIKDGHIQGSEKGYTVDGVNLKAATKPMIAKLEKFKNEDFRGQAEPALNVEAEAE